MAKDWHSQAEIQKDAAIYGKFVLVLCGIAAWDFLSTLPFDWSIISGKRKFRWPMVVWISKVTDAIGTPVSSGILLLRTAAVWHQKKRVWIPLGCMLLVQIILWIQTFRYSRSEWNEQRRSCVILATAPNPLIVAVFSYTMAFDFVIMALCAYRLFKARSSSAISNLLFRDGIVYFAAAFGANLLQSVLAALTLNQVMNIFALPFALVVSVIASTAVFRNVFILYDGFAGGPSSNSRPTTSGQAVIGNTMGNNRNTTRKMSMSKRNQTGMDSFALNPVSHTASHNHQAFGLGGIEVTKVVDVNVDIERGAQAHYGNSAAKKGQLDDDNLLLNLISTCNMDTTSTPESTPTIPLLRGMSKDLISIVSRNPNIRINLNPEESITDLQFFFRAFQRHFQLLKENLNMIQTLRPFPVSNFLDILMVAVNELDSKIRGEADDNMSEVSDPGDSTYEQNWDPLELASWMLAVFTNMPPEARNVWSDLIQSLEKRLERRFAELRSLQVETKDDAALEGPAEAAADATPSLHDNTALPLQYLPPEIVGEIFLLAAQDAPLMPITLSHIDRFSRHVATNLPKLWSLISIKLAPRIAGLYLERSKSVPLVVDAVVPPLHDNWTPKALQRINDFLSAARPHSHRVQELKIRQYFSEAPQAFEILNFLFTSPLGKALSVLEIGGREDFEHPFQDPTYLDDGWKESRLMPESLAVYGVHHTNWAFRTISFNQLAHLEISENSDLPFRVYLAALGRCPLLETLTLSRLLITGEDADDFPTVSLPRLRAFELDHSGAPGLPFFDQMGPFPELRTLTMSYVAIDDERPDTDFSRFMHRHASIQIVHLDDFFSTNQGWHMIFACFPSATHLRLSNCALEDEDLAILDASSTHGEGGIMMLNLTHITLENEWGIESQTVLRLLASRSANNVAAEGSKVETLHSVVLRGWHNSKLKEMKLTLAQNPCGVVLFETTSEDGVDSNSNREGETDYECCWSDVDPNELAFD
ncbi:hypothetical protein FRB90_003442 [Tulasnella sp. 427]|nr:hypothetical protein FRB90_003442 [Tulasnella sp. 427]